MADAGRHFRVPSAVVPARQGRGLRERALNEAEIEAQQATEHMSLPVVLMFSGFLGLIGYPAIAAILNS